MINKKYKSKRKEEKMKKSKRKGIYIVLLLLLVVGIFLLGNSYSKYVTQVDGKGVIEVAKWAFLVNGQTASITNLSLAQTYQSDTLVENHIAPGTRGSFDIIVDATGSDVGIDYKVTFANETNKPNNMKFYYNGIMANSIKELETLLAGNISAETENKIRTMTIEWEWSYETGTTKEEIKRQDSIDTQDGQTLNQYQFDILITGTQVEPN